MEWGFEERRGDCVERKDFWGNIGLGNFQNMQATLRYLSVKTGRELALARPSREGPPVQKDNLATSCSTPVIPRG